jgi:radical SAM protein with 4Fe4S-binding SPASM domain
LEGIILTVKNSIKKLPGFNYLNYWRYKILDLKVFDFHIIPTASIAKKLANYPIEMFLCTAGYCNAKCAWCICTRVKDGGIMDLEFSKKIIKEYFPSGGSRLQFGVFGEPLLDPYLLERIEFTRTLNSNAEIGFFTNASLLNINIARKLAELGVTVIISLDELDENIFFKIKKIRFRPVFENVINFVKVYNEKNRNNYEIKIKTIQKDIIENRNFQLLKGLTDKIHLAPIGTQQDILINWTGNLDLKKFYREFMDGRLPPKKNVKLGMVSPCFELWNAITINWDGKVVLCCRDGLGEVILGDLKKESIKEVWTGEKISSIRQLALQRERDKLKLCKDCDFYTSWRYLRKVVNL